MSQRHIPHKKMRSYSVHQTCRRCLELACNRRQIVHGYGDLEADFMFIGEAPGKNGADVTGVPFTRDRSGKRLQRLLIQLGLSQVEAKPKTRPIGVERSEELDLARETHDACETPHLINCYVTNLVRCNPPGNRNPTKTEIENCQPYLEEEIQRVQPKVVIPVGNFAMRWVFRTYRGITPEPITQVHARIFRGTPFTVVPMKHPARISHRMLSQIEATLQDLIHEV